MAQAVAWHALRLGIPCTVIVPDHAPETKLVAIARLGGTVVKVPFERWWQTLVERSYPGGAIVCIISGGNINFSTLAKILTGSPV